MSVSVGKRAERGRLLRGTVPSAPPLRQEWRVLYSRAPRASPARFQALPVPYRDSAASSISSACHPDPLLSSRCASRRVDGADLDDLLGVRRAGGRGVDHDVGRAPQPGLHRVRLPGPVGDRPVADAPVRPEPPQRPGQPGAGLLAELAGDAVRRWTRPPRGCRRAGTSAPGPPGTPRSARPRSRSRECSSPARRAAVPRRRPRPFRPIPSAAGHTAAETAPAAKLGAPGPG